ncbi:hypothetical protein AAFF_G00334660 [Aldrovandia affinis]|uniref:Prokaryotic-type class I peptide chain release factors domain-containing protein n=1 Tax=Aldrovandia affinis TaxID=143900 RepID=A0AAD7SLB9_9TELE|nr:hypothetical protein AAFF_G00334660 [Aldrovandia affinis]
MIKCSLRCNRANLFRLSAFVTEGGSQHAGNMYKLVRLSCGVCTSNSFLRSVQNSVQTKLLTTPRKPRSPLCSSSWDGGFSRQRTYSTDTGYLLRGEAAQKHLQGLLAEYNRITQRLENGLLNDSERRVLNRRQVELMPLATAFQNTENAVKDLKEVEALFQSGSGADEDPQMLELLKKEQEEISKRIDTLRKELFQTLIPHDRHDTNNVILEVVAGRTTGGDICQQFTREVFDMYECFSSYKNWEFEVLNYSPAEYGGLHHAAARISGDMVYRQMKYEGGTHRVQRIPEVGLSSRMERIHTGTMTVIVLPQPSEIDVSIDPKDLRIDTFRSSGAGGQSVNTTDSAVRITHTPTGIAVECQQSRSQLQNRDTAMRVLRARMYQQMIGQESEQRQTARKHQVGTRSQSDRIRTYNFTQNRVTDHRIGYMTRDIKGFLRGGEALDELIADLSAHADREALLELLEHGGHGRAAEGKDGRVRTPDP